MVLHIAPPYINTSHLDGDVTDLSILDEETIYAK